MKRWYKSADVSFIEGGWQVMLDGKSVRTPLKNPLIVPTEKLAELISKEWAAQDETIDKLTMPLTGYAAVAIDIVPVQRLALSTEMLAYSQTDLLCYRAEDEKLAQRQAEVFDPLIKQLADIYGLKLNVTKGVMPVLQPQENQAIIEEYAEVLGDFHFAGLMVGMQTLSSLFLAMLLKDEHIDEGLALRVARFDEIAQAERWGITDTFTQKQQLLQNEIASLARFSGCLSG